MSVVEEKSGEPHKARKANPLLLNSAVIILCLVASIPVVIAYWRIFYRSVLEVGSPELEVGGIQRGFGLAPRKLTFTLSDDGAGLDEIVVRVSQRSYVKEVLRQKLDGKAQAVVNLDFDAKAFKLNEGRAKILVRVFDRAIWSNSGEAEFEPRIEYRPPQIRAVSAQHNARHGGSQLILYDARDDTKLVNSGVAVGPHRFPGLAAAYIDTTLVDPNLFFTMYAVDLNVPADEEPILYAHDEVGNEDRSGFTNQIMTRKTRPGQYRGGEDSLKGFREKDLLDRLPGFTREIYWTSPFLIPKASVNLSFGDEGMMTTGSGVGTKRLITGFRFKCFSGACDATASQAGSVAFVFEGRPKEYVVGIDHGAGVVSVYSHLGEVVVKAGARVMQGELLGTAKRLSDDVPQLYYEIRVHGVAVDPREWWEERWFNDHILRKLQEVRWVYGIKSPKKK